MNLGYRRPEAQPTVARVTERLGAAASLDAIIRESLKELADSIGGDLGEPTASIAERAIAPGT